jgi:hypothetical protein
MTTSAELQEDHAVTTVSVLMVALTQVAFAAVLSVGTELLAQRFPGAADITRPMVRALVRLRELASTLAITDHWHSMPGVGDLGGSVPEAARDVYQAIHGEKQELR